MGLAHRSRWLLAAAIGAASFTPLDAEASVSSTTLLRTPTPPGMLVTETGSFAAQSAYVDDKSGLRTAEIRDVSSVSLHRFVPPAKAFSSVWLFATGTRALSLLGTLDVRPGHALIAHPMATDASVEWLISLEQRHQRWFRTGFTALQLGQQAHLRDEAIDVLPRLSGVSRFGHDVDWSKGQLSIIPREILEREVRIEIRAYLSKPHLKRVAEYESIGELVLELPSGWPKSYRAQGRWKLPVYTLAGKQTIEGIFTDETTWTYTPNATPPLPLPADLVK